MCTIIWTLEDCPISVALLSWLSWGAVYLYIMLKNLFRSSKVRILSTDELARCIPCFPQKLYRDSGTYSEKFWINLRTKILKGRSNANIFKTWNDLKLNNVVHFSPSIQHFLDQNKQEEITHTFHELEFGAILSENSSNFTFCKYCRLTWTSVMVGWFKLS